MRFFSQMSLTLLCAAVLSTTASAEEPVTLILHFRRSSITVGELILARKRPWWKLVFTTTTQTPQGQGWLSVNDPADRRKLDMVRNLTPRATINARVWHGLTLSDSEPLRRAFHWLARPAGWWHR